MCVDELGVDGDAVGRVVGVLHDDGCVADHSERDDGREVLSSLGRRVRATSAVGRSRRGKMRQVNVEVLHTIPPEELELGHPNDQLADVGEEMLLLERARIVVGGERHRLGNLAGMHCVLCRFRLDVLSSERCRSDGGLHWMLLM